MNDLFAPLLGDVVALAHRAGEEVSRHYRVHCETPVTPDRKVDGSPVTIADHASEAVLIEGLLRLAPSVPILSEEQVAKGVIADISGGTFWCVDPLDGTKEYLGCTDEFTICVAGMVDFRPVFGVLYAPALGLTFGGVVGQGAFRFAPDGSKTKIVARARPASGSVALVSRSHGDSAEQKYLDDAGIAEKRVMGSAIKFGLIAAGVADLYVRFGPTCEWDTAAGQAVLDAAGGSLETFDGAPLGYGKPKFLNGGFVAKGR